MATSEAAEQPVRNGGSRLGRPPGATAAATRLRILAAAEELFAQVGYNAATNQTIAEHSGVTTSSIYHHFGSKRDLYIAVSERVHDRIFGRYEERALRLRDLPGRLSSIVESSIELHRDNPLIARFLVTSYAEARNNAELTDVHTALVARLSGFSRRLTHGVPIADTEDLRPDDVANMFSAVFLGFAGLADLIESTDTVARSLRAFESLVQGRLVPAPQQP